MGNGMNELRMSLDITLTVQDNLWPITTSLIFTPVRNEFNPTRPPFLTLAQNIGLLFGAVFWGFGCDIFGRRWAFNLTIGITAVFGLVAAGSPNFIDRLIVRFSSSSCQGAINIS
jgi:MFS family permease